MDVIALRPDLKPAVGDRIAAALDEMMADLHGASASRAGLQFFSDWTQRLVLCSQLVDTRDFDIRTFASIVYSHQTEVQTVVKLVTNLGWKLLQMVDSILLSGSGHCGRAQLRHTVGVCCVLLDAGCILRNLCLELGRGGDVDWEDLDATVTRLRRNAEVAFERLRGASSAPTPAHCPETYAWLQVFTVALSVRIALTSQPQFVMITMSKRKDTKTHRLLRAIKRFTSCLTQTCEDAVMQQQKVGTSGTDATSVSVFLPATAVDAPAQTRAGLPNWPWAPVEDLISRTQESPDEKLMRVQRRLYRSPDERREEQERLKGVPEEFLKMMETKQRFSRAGEPQDNFDDRAHIRPYTLGPEVFVRAIAMDYIQTRVGRDMAKLEDIVRKCMTRISESSMGPAERLAEQELVMKLYEQRKNEIYRIYDVESLNRTLAKTAEETEDEAEKVRLTMNRVLKNIDRRSAEAAQAARARARESGQQLSVVDAFSLAFAQQHTPTQTREETLLNRDQLHEDNAVVHLLKDFLGPSPQTPTVVALTSRGTVPIPEALRPVAAVVVSVVLYFSGGDFAINHFSTRIARCLSRSE